MTESEEFLLLPVNQLIDIISSDELNVRSEEQVFNAVLAWVKYNVAERRGHLPQVCFSFSKINFFSSEYILILALTPSVGVAARSFASADTQVLGRHSQLGFAH